MRTSNQVIFTFVTTALLTARLCFAQQSTALTYDERSGPPERVAATTRGGSAPVPSVIAPDRAGWTLSDQPQLFWYLSETTELPVGISLINDDTGDTVYEVTLTKGTTAGYHCVDLSKENVTLDPNKRYRLAIAVIPDKKDRSKDMVASGIVVRVKAPEDLAKNLAAAQGMDRAALLLKAGIWFDGIAEVMAQISSQKDNANVIVARDTLLRRVGLDLTQANASKNGSPASVDTSNLHP